MRKTLAVGHFLNAPFIEICAPYLGRIREIFFAWPGVLSCRPAPDFTPEVRNRLLTDLKWARDNGLKLDTLFNCNCYGDKAISSELADFADTILAEMDKEGLYPDIVTTTSPFLATMFRRNHPNIKLRLSVNMRVHGTAGFEPIMELFDSFYASREHHRDLNWLSNLSSWAKANGKIVGMQANSGCLRQCAFQQFHDNMHGHNRIAQSAEGEKMDFSVFLCKTNYERGNYEDFLRSTWIRPEDLPLYEEHVDIVKLATRRHPYPEKIVKAYATYDYDGNLADLMDACHKFPKSFDNKSFDDNKSLWESVRSCQKANDCNHCGKCTDLMTKVFA